MEQNMQINKNNAEIKSDSESKPIRSSSKKYLAKKIVVLVLFLLILAVAGYAYSLFLGGKDDNQLFLEQNKEILEKEKAEEVEINKNSDTDKDGLPDYLEKVIGTGESNPDTDGDGYDDLAEIKNGYDPLGDKKFTDEEWDDVKEEIKGEDEGLFEEMFGSVDDNINTPKTETGDFICGTTTVSDIDNNVYNTVQIGSQCWLKENLKVTKNPAGEAITRYCYDNDPSICDTDGGLYDWNTAMNNSTQEGAQGICPNGWHVPKDEEWYISENELADKSCSNNREGIESLGCDPAGAKLKINGLSGFNAILAGELSGEGFGDRGINAIFWSSTESDNYNAWRRYLTKYFSEIDRFAINKMDGNSVRCLKD